MWIGLRNALSAKGLDSCKKVFSRARHNGRRAQPAKLRRKNNSEFWQHAHPTRNAGNRLTDDRRLNSPQSVTRVIQILEALCASPTPLSLASLSRVLHAPKSSIAALLRGLARADFVVSSEGAYRLGPSAFGLGSALLEARRRLQSSDLIRDGMRRLAERSGETVLFAVRDANAQTMTYVDVIESRNTVRFAVSVGDRPDRRSGDRAD